MVLQEINPDPKFLATFRSELIRWGNENYRSFPWRSTDNPYYLLIAETLLHRTQATQVIEIYNNFIIKYPDPESLSGANKEDLKTDLFSLGLHWRIDLIQDMAIVLMEEYDGKIPEEKDDLMSLPGVGPYITSSVRCFAYGYPDAIIDTNVMRVLTRVLDISFRDSLRRNRQFIELAQEFVDPEYPREYNFAILDLANIMCKPKSPDCTHCPLNARCLYSLHLVYAD